MGRLALLILLVVGWLADPAIAAPIARQRVVLADLDPELRDAMARVLAPWHLEIVIEGPPPVDTAMARERADADTARFVVWRDGEQLVVYDRELGSTERRDSRSGVLDPPTAAAAALTIKTMMRLPPPPAEPSSPPPSAAVERVPWLRIQAGVATRIAHGAGTDVSARFGGMVAFRPWSASSWRFGLAGDGGTATTVSGASFEGTWREWAVLGVVSWTFARGAWELEPHAGAGIRRSTLDGTEMGAPRSEAATLAMVRAGMWVRRRYARWTLGAALGADLSLDAPTYSKSIGAAQIFQVPGLAVELGAVMAVDL